jgi:competence protein ComEC
VHSFSLVKHFSFYLILVLTLVCAGVWSVVYAEAPQAPGVLTFALLDVGQGDALYIESPTGVQLLVDAGPTEALLRELPALMPPMDRTLDAIVATHPDADHIGGFAELLERYDVGVYISPGIPKGTATAKKLETAVDAKEIPRITARRGMSLELGGGARLDILYPDHDVSNLPEDKVNEGGIVARLVYGASEALLMADVGFGVETRLLQLDASELDSDLLKVGHHGSKYSTAQKFVASVSPEVALISVGKNSYGHPTPQVLNILENAQATILRTDEKGTIKCVSDGARFSCSPI